MALTEAEETLIAKAREIIQRRRKPVWHTVGCAMRTRSGREFAAVHLEAYVGRAAICAEAIAIGMAAAEGDTDIEQIVAVDYEGNIVAPCGICRELIHDYSSEATVLVPDSQGVISVPVKELLPNKYHRKATK